ncbi:hypothetical protein N7456_006619 [Penicillium angulare]|uniref:Uncharacterized protein n=1 Tax=Penicillium angulare TaxID=116970 RepID=A0A9W9FIF6_9EURO|nr:hypothetical protein N7456_006619 [Penicillium angulare]
MEDCHMKVADDARQQMVDEIFGEPQVSYVSFKGHEHRKEGAGRMFSWAGKEALVYTGEESQTHSGHWRGTVTVDIEANFSVETF